MFKKFNLEALQGRYLSTDCYNVLPYENWTVKQTWLLLDKLFSAMQRTKLQHKLRDFVFVAGKCIFVLDRVWGQISICSPLSWFFQCDVGFRITNGLSLLYVFEKKAFKILKIDYRMFKKFCCQKQSITGSLSWNASFFISSLSTPFHCVCISINVGERHRTIQV